MYLLLSLLVALVYAKAPLLDSEHAEIVAGQYIVVYHPSTDRMMQIKHQYQFGSNVFATYNITNEFMGYAAKLTPEQLEQVRDDPIVNTVYHDSMVHIYGKQGQQQECDSQQTNVRAWGICRVSHWGSITDHGSALTTYKWDAGAAGSGVDVYVIDTGIKLTHQEFEGRAVWGANYVDSIRDDNNGHGTHCAGTIGGATVGLARDCRLVAVRVLNGQGSGTTSGVISGINYVANTAATRGVPSVGSMSLGGGYSAAMNTAVKNLVSSGVPCAVAAGNDNADACNYSPASEPSAITVGSTSTDANQRDTRSSFSNYGSCVDIFAPGSNIYSCGITSNTAYTSLSGTSMACPHVAGLCAVVLHTRPHLSPAGVKAAIMDEGNHGRITNPNSPNNILAYSGC
jgi:subtilisin family serine protease